MEDRLRCLEAVLRDHGVDCDLAGLARAWQQGELGLYIYLRASPELRRQLDLWIMDQSQLPRPDGRGLSLEGTFGWLTAPQ